MGEFSLSRNSRIHLKLQTNNGILNGKEFRISGKLQNSNQMSPKERWRHDAEKDEDKREWKIKEWDIVGKLLGQCFKLLTQVRNIARNVVFFY